MQSVSGPTECRPSCGRCVDSFIESIGLGVALSVNLCSFHSFQCSEGSIRVFARVRDDCLLPGTTVGVGICWTRTFLGVLSVISVE